MFTTRDLALYGAIVGTLGGAWTLYVSLVLDRARVIVRVHEGIGVAPGSGARMNLFTLSVSNRGRRGTSIQTAARVVSARHGTNDISFDFLRQLSEPLRLGEGESRSILHGIEGGYQLGDLPLRRWFVIDGAGRVHPLRERYRQRLERTIFRPWRWWKRAERNRPV